MANEDRIVGATIAGKYRVRRIIGAGSMGVVCEAEHVDIGKRVAIKLIDASLAGMQEIALRFRQEARAASLVESQHIVQVFDVGADDVLGLYLVMELLVGEDLAKVLARERRLPAARAVRIALQVGRGLARAHEAGVVHRDLKPANIFLCARDDDEPTAKILDFGISKVVASSRPGGAPGLNLTRDGMVVGTPQYMSPEQAQGFAVDARTDIWSLGLVLYEMLAGRPAYPELPSYERFIIHLVSEPPEPIREVAPWVSEELAAVVHGALEHDLEKRVPSCAELVRRLVEVDPLLSGPQTRGPAREPRSPIADVPDTLVMPRPEVPPAMSAGAVHRQPAPVPDPAPNGPNGPDESGAVPSSRAAPSWLGSSGVRGAVRASLQPADDFEQEAPQFFDRRMLKSLGGPRAAEPSPPAPSGSPPTCAAAMSARAPGRTSLAGAAVVPAVGVAGPALGEGEPALASGARAVRARALGATAARRSWRPMWVAVLLAVLVLVAVAALALR
ncbi:MAG: protein kinase [Myxococcales bacterium]|nr:protein kinase [Myxococcales bacterium]